MASNSNAPLALRHGPLRDAVLAVEVAMADGRVLRLGRPLVKNVAGYDLPKVFVGSHGTLGLLTRITLRLVPAPRARRTLALALPDLDTGLELARVAIGRAILASGIVLSGDGDDRRLLYTAEGPSEEVEVELASIAEEWRSLASETPVEEKRSATEAWRERLAGAAGDDLLVRAGVAPRDLGALLATWPPERSAGFVLDCAAGTLYVRLSAPEPAEAVAWLAALRRAACGLGGYAVATRLPARLATTLDPWGYHPPAIAVMRRLKELWDPAGILPEAFLGSGPNPQVT